MDKAQRQTALRLRDLEKRLAQNYKEAAKDVFDRLDEAITEFKKQDAEKKKKIMAGYMSFGEYANWVNENVREQKRLGDMFDILQEDFTNADKAAAAMINNEIAEIYALNANYGTYEIDKKTGFNISGSFTLYSHEAVEKIMIDGNGVIPKARVDIPKDMQWNRRKLEDALTQGILAGDSIPHLAERLEAVAVMDRNAAIRNARTMTTAAQNGGRVESYERAVERGIKLRQQWVATLDERTRSSHRHMDGEIVEVGKVFSNGLRYPGDPSGDPSEFWNCRCTLVVVDPLFDNDIASLSSRFSRLPTDMSYEKWKESKSIYGN